MKEKLLTSLICLSAFMLLFFQGRAQAPVADYSPDPAYVCLGDTVFFTDLSTNSPTSWQWTFGDGDTSYQQHPAHVYSTDGAYTVELVVSNGSGSDTASGTAEVNIPPYVSTTGTDPSCFGICDGEATGTLDSGGTAPFSYVWAHGATTSTISNVCPGSYTFIVTDAVGCTGSSTITLTEPAALTVSITGTDASCNGLCDGEAEASVGGGTSPYTYLWNDPSAQSSSTATGLCSGTYTITVTDSNACEATANVTILEPPALSININVNSHVSCFGGNNGQATANVSGGTPGYDYVWNTSPNQTSATANGLSANTYTVIITDTNGCTISESVNILEPPLLQTFTTADPVSCFGDCNGSGSINASGGTSPYVYNWTDGAGNTYAGPSQSGILCPDTYIITVTDANSCTVVDTIIITEPALLTGTMTVTEAFCSQNDGSAMVNINGGTPSYSYFWSSSAGTTATVNNLYAGVYTVTVTDSNGCTEIVTDTVPGDDPLVVYVSGTDESCDGACNGMAQVDSVTGGAGYYTPYYWSNGETDTIINNLCPATYSVTVTDINGCVAIESVIITTSSPDCVWPGDVNYDGIANSLDLLDLGLAYGTAGPARPGATINWTAQPASDWADTLPGGTNYKHADCNGDGIVNDDALAISQNYGMTHNKMQSMHNGRSGDPLLHFYIEPDSVPTDSALQVEIRLGTSDNPASDIYGLAFTVNYNPVLLDSGSFGYSHSGSWMAAGLPASSLISVSHNFYSSGKLDLGISRTDQNHVTGDGVIAKMNMRTVDNTGLLMLTFSDVTVIDSGGNPVPVDLGADSVMIIDMETLIGETNGGLPELKIYPNPAREILNIVIAGESAIDELIIFDVLGEEMKRFPGTVQNKVLVSTSQWSPGFYYVRVRTAEGTQVKKVAVVK